MHVYCWFHLHKNFNINFSACEIDVGQTVGNFFARFPKTAVHYFQKQVKPAVCTLRMHTWNRQESGPITSITAEGIKSCNTRSIHGVLVYQAMPWCSRAWAMNLIINWSNFLFGMQEAYGLFFYYSYGKTNHKLPSKHRCKNFSYLYCYQHNRMNNLLMWPSLLKHPAQKTACAHPHLPLYLGGQKMPCMHPHLPPYLGGQKMPGMHPLYLGGQTAGYLLPPQQNQRGVYIHRAHRSVSSWHSSS